MWNERWYGRKRENAISSHVVCMFSPMSVVPGATSASSTLQITTSNGQHGVKKTPAGTYDITISGVSGRSEEIDGGYPGGQLKIEARRRKLFLEHNAALHDEGNLLH